MIAAFAFIFMGCPQNPILLDSISITKVPTKVEYEVGEKLNTAGMEVTAVYSDSSTKVVTNWTTSGFDSSKAAEKQIVTVSYTEDEITKTATFTVKIKEAPAEEDPEQTPEENPEKEKTEDDTSDEKTEDEAPAENPEKSDPKDDDSGKTPGQDDDANTVYEKLPVKVDDIWDVVIFNTSKSKYKIVSHNENSLVIDILEDVNDQIHVEYKFKEIDLNDLQEISYKIKASPAGNMFVGYWADETVGCNPISAYSPEGVQSNFVTNKYTDKTGVLYFVTDKAGRYEFSNIAATVYEMPSTSEHMELIAMDNGCIQINVKGLPAKETASNFDTHELEIMENGQLSRIGLEIPNDMEKTEYTYYYPFTDKNSKYVVRLICVFKDVATGKNVRYDEKAEITAKADYKKFSDYFSIENFDKMKLSSEYNSEYVGYERFDFIFDAASFTSYKDVFPADKVNNVHGDFGFCSGPTNWQNGATWDGGNNILYDEQEDNLYTKSINYSKLGLFPGEIVKFPVMWGPATSEIIKKIKSKNNTYCAYSYWKFSITEFGDSVYMIKKWSDPLEFVEKPIYEGNPFVGKWVAHYENGQTEVIEVDVYGNLIHSFLVNNSLFYALRGRWNPESSDGNTYLWCRQTDGIGSGYTEWTSGVVNSPLELYLNTSEEVPYLTDRWGESKYKKDTSTVSNAEVTVGLINDLDVKIIKTDNNDGTITFSINYNKIFEPLAIVWSFDMKSNESSSSNLSTITVRKSDFSKGNHMVNLMVYASGSFTTIFSDTLYFTVE